MDYASLDPGIRSVVRLLRDAGFETTDSGDGVSKPPECRVMDFPHVATSTTAQAMCADADRMLGLLGEGWHVEASYCANDRTCILLATSADPAGA